MERIILVHTLCLDYTNINVVTGQRSMLSIQEVMIKCFCDFVKENKLFCTLKCIRKWFHHVNIIASITKRSILPYYK